MHERARSRGARRLGNVARTLILHGLEGLLSARAKNADEIDHGIGALGRRKQRVRKAHIGLHRGDLADAAKRLKKACKLRPAHGNPHPGPGLGQRADHMAANEA